VAIRVIVVGKASRDPLIAAADDYLKRLTRHVRAEASWVEAGRRGKRADDARVRALEGDAILKRAAGARLIALDRSGRSLDSEAFAARLERWLGAGDLAFAIGGATGLHADVLTTAEQVLSFGPMTLSHRLARLVLCEQLYRAMAILRGEPYHK